MNKPVKISSFSVSENRYCTKGGTYRVKDLIKLACKLKPFDLPLQGIDISVRPWGDVNMKSFCYHVRRINDADMTHPIILDDEGFICDGWHRVAKAIIEGQATIKAVRLDVMPDAVEVDGK